MDKQYEVFIDLTNMLIQAEKVRREVVSEIEKDYIIVDQIQDELILIPKDRINAV